MCMVSTWHAVFIECLEAYGLHPVAMLLVAIIILIDYFVQLSKFEFLDCPASVYKSSHSHSLIVIFHANIKHGYRAKFLSE